MKFSRISIFLLIILLICLTSNKCRAQQETSKNQSKSLEEPGTCESGLTWQVDEVHERISGYLLSSAAWLDSFFSNESYEAEVNKSHLKVRLSSFFEEGEGIEFKARLNLRIVLDNLNDKFHIIISGNPDSHAEPDFASETRINKEFTEKNDKQETLAFALQYFLQSTRKNNFKMEAGIRWGRDVPVLWGGPRFRWSFNNNLWVYRFTQRVRWFTDEGWYVKSSFDCEKSLNKTFFFRSTAEGIWEQEEDGYNYGVYCNLYQTLSNKRALKYQLGNSYETSPASQLKEIVFRVSYRRQIWKKWIALEVKPQISFPRDNDFELTPGITVLFEGIFGWNP
ncbi:Uncharacterized protein dnl_00810 [Desulfonema limicola]|uniref:DUF481 domain-containing protein n=1 Tax=Desulfonema limicola TaxID=45656 RepID=A0A975B328_9BACT|nr:hypothetical protein [Desulfonema limicola]QTA77883.1 Uncharacterized protein dnl_00810 [Desulfonema limicola]